MANTVQLKRSSVPGRIPDAPNIAVGEPAVNLVDKILYTKDGGGNVIVIGSGTTSNIAEGSNLYFTNSRAIGAFTEGSGINIDANGLITSTASFSGTSSNISGGSNNQLLVQISTNETGFIAAPTSNNTYLRYDGNSIAFGTVSIESITYTANSISLDPSYGTYNSGNILSIQTVGDYNLDANNYYSINETATTPGYIAYIDFINVDKFNRIAINLFYTQNSSHVIYVDLYNNDTSAWDSFGTYNGLGSYYQFALSVLDYLPYKDINNRVQLRLYHASAGNTGHNHRIDYVAIEYVTQGPQGPKGTTGATGATGATGPGVATGGTAGQILLKANSDNYATFWGDPTTSNISEGSNLYYTNNRVYSNVIQLNYITASSLSGYATNSQLTAYALDTDLTTANVTELTNLYFTNARSRQAISAGTGVNYSNSTGVISIGQAVGTSSDVEFHDITITGNLTVAGITTTINARELAISDNMIYLNEAIPETIVNVVGDGANVTYTLEGNITHQVGEVIRVTDVNPNVYNTGYVTIIAVTGNAITIASSNTGAYVSGGNAFIKASSNPDLGFSGGYNDGSYHHAGLFRDASDGTWKFFENYGPEPDANVFIDTSHPTFSLANVAAKYFIGPVIGNVSSIANHSTANLTEGTNLYFTNARVYSNVTQLGYITSSSLSGYATNSQLALYATNAQLASYATNSQLAVYATNSQLAVYATNAQLTSYALDADLTTANVIELTNLYFTNARVYSNVTQLGYITSSSLSGYATNSQLALYATNAQLALYATNAQLASYALTASLTTANVSELTNLYFTNARVYSNVIQLGYITSSSLSGYATNSQLGLYATNAQLASYATNSQLALYATNSQLSSYATVANLNLKANTTQLAVYATNAQLAVYATNAQLASYATNAQLASYATNSQLALYATNSQLSSYATTANLALKANITDLTTANVTEVTNLYFTNARSYSNTLAAIKTGNGIIYSNTTGNITLSATGVTATTYGNATIVPIITVDAHGRITSVSNVNISGVSSGGSTGTSNAISATQTIFANAGTTTYALTSYPSTSNTLIFIDGLLQFPTTDYSFSSNNLVLTSTPQTGETIYVVTLYPASSSGGGGGASVTISSTAPSASTAGVFWLDSDYLDMYVSYDNTWVMISGSGSSLGEIISPLLLPGM